MDGKGERVLVVHNVGTLNIPSGCPMEMCGIEGTAEPIHKVRAPATASLSQVLVNGDSMLYAGSYSSIPDSWPRWSSFSGATQPTIGGQVGVASGTLGMQSGNTGFVCLAIHGTATTAETLALDGTDSNGAVQEGRALVRPFSGAVSHAVESFKIYEWAEWPQFIVHGGSAITGRVFDSSSYLTPELAGTYNSTNGYWTLKGFSVTEEPSFSGGVRSIVLKSAGTTPPITKIAIGTTSSADLTVIPVMTGKAYDLGGSLAAAPYHTFTWTGQPTRLILSATRHPTNWDWRTDIYKLSDLGAVISGTLSATSGTSGQSVIPVTSSGSFSLYEHNDVLIGGTRYHLTSSSSRPSAGTADISISPSLSSPISESASVEIVSSWVPEYNCTDFVGASSNTLAYPNIVYRGKVQEDASYSIMLSGKYGNGSYDEETAYFGLVYDSQVDSWDKIGMPTYLSSSVYYKALTPGHLMTSLNTTWLLGSKTTDNGSTWSFGFIKWLGGNSWGTPVLPSGSLPAGFTVSSTTPSYLAPIYVPDGRVFVGLQIYNGNTGDVFFVLVQLHGDNDPEYVTGADGDLIIFTTTDVESVGCSSDGWDIDNSSNGDLIFSGNWGFYPELKSQYITSGTNNWLLLGENYPYLVLHGAGNGGTIAGSLNAEDSIIQPGGSTDIRATASDGDAEIKKGNLISVGAGANTRHYRVREDVKIGSNTSGIIRLDTQISIGLTGGENITIASGWSQRVTKLLSNSQQPMHKILLSSRLRRGTIP